MRAVGYKLRAPVDTYLSPDCLGIPLTRVRRLVVSHVILLLLLALTAGVERVYAQPGWEGLVRYGFESTIWNVDNGLPQNSNQRVLRGSDGSIWMSGFGTPARFDGYSFQATPLRGVPRGGTVLGDGLMPCAGEGMCAAVMGHGIWRVLGDSLSEQLAAFDLTGYARDEYADAIIVRTSEQADPSFYLVRADTTYRLGPYPPLGSTRTGLVTVAMGRDGTLYSYSDRRQIWKLKDGTWSLHSTKLAGFTSSNMFGDSEGTIWTMGESGILRLTPSGAEPFSLLGWSRHIIPYEGGYLTAGQGGVFRLSSDGTVLDTLATQHANWLYADDSGVVWVALESDGVMRLRPHRIGSVDLGGFGTSGVRGIARDRDGSLWTTGNCQGILNFTQRGGRTVYKVSDEQLDTEQWVKISSCLWTVAQTPDGTVWTTGIGGLLHNIRDGRIRLIDEAVGTSNFTLQGGSTVLFTDREGTLWTSRRSDGRIYRRTDSGTFVHVPAWHLADSLGGGAFNVVQFFEDAEDVLWIGGPGYVSRFDGMTFAPILRVKGDARTFAQADDGTLYVGTYGGGIYRLDRDAQIRGRSKTLNSSDVPRFRASDGLPDDFVSFLHIDATRPPVVDPQSGTGAHPSTGSRRVSEGRTLNLLTFARSRRRTACRVPRPTAGFRAPGWSGPTVRCGFRRSRGWPCSIPIWRTTFSLPRRPISRPQRLMVCQSLARAMALVRLNWRRPTVAFGFRIGALTAEHPRNIELDARLSDGSGQWEEVDPLHRSITYGGLRGGSYRLEARARSADGTWGDAVLLATLVVPTPLYQTPLFLIAAAIALALGIVGTVGLRDHALRARERDLQSAVDQQTSELRHASERMETQNVALADLLKSKERVMRMVSHDLKNPIGGIVGLAEVIAEDLPPESEAAEMIGIIHDAGEQALMLIHSILDADNTAVPTNSELPTVDLRAVVRAATALSRGFARTKEQHLHTVLPDVPVTVRADALRLRLIVDNLVSNALKYAPLGSDVHLEITLEDDHAVLIVDDAGPGIPVDQRVRVFDPYTRLDAQPTGSETATGLGLFLAREIVQQYDGTITAGESPEGGARFTVRLPLAVE